MRKWRQERTYQVGPVDRNGTCHHAKFHRSCSRGTVAIAYRSVLWRDGEAVQDDTSVVHLCGTCARYAIKEYHVQHVKRASSSDYTVDWDAFAKQPDEKPVSHPTDRDEALMDYLLEHQTDPALSEFLKVHGLWFETVQDAKAAMEADAENRCMSLTNYAMPQFIGEIPLLFAIIWQMQYRTFENVP